MPDELTGEIAKCRSHRVHPHEDRSMAATRVSVPSDAWDVSATMPSTPKNDAPAVTVISTPADA